MCYYSLNRQMPATERFAYDEVPYPGQPYPETHPDRLATMAILFGMTPPPVTTARVLEVGCGDGSNLIPLAYALPNASFVGFDLAATSVNAAKSCIQQLQLPNIMVDCRNLLDFPAECEPFDYIIAHGFYSWVPPEVQQALLRLCSAHLAPDGVAFISYNTHPAGHIRQASRNMMRYHLARTSQGSTRAAKELVRLLSSSVAEGSAWKAVLGSESKRLSKTDDNVTFHDDLSPFSTPLYFHEFVTRASEHHLQFLAEARLRDTTLASVNPTLHSKISELADGDILAYQQYLDFFVYKGFRRTLLCHDHVKLQREAPHKQLPKLFLASPLTLTATRESTVSFTNTRGKETIETNNPQLISTLKCLEAIWPQGEELASLLPAATAEVAASDRDHSIEALLQSMFDLGAAGLVDLRTYKFRLADGMISTPQASAIARLQNAHGKRVLTTLLHASVKIEDEQTRELIRLLDGTHDDDELAVLMRQKYPFVMQSELQATLRGLCRTGLLVA